MKRLRYVRDAALSMTGRQIRIVAYHSISDSNEDLFTVGVDTFRRHIEWLSEQKYRVISLEEVVEQIAEGKVESRSVAITFDDGYQDNWENAVPLLKELGFKATFFVVTGYVGQISEWSGEQDLAGRRLMNWKQLRELAKEGHTIGSHSMTHPDLRKISIEKLEGELSDSREMIENEIGRGFIPFAYPFGFWGNREAEAARNAGYEAAVISGGFFGNNRWTDRWRIRREVIDGNMSLKDFSRTLRGWNDISFFKFAISELVQMFKPDRRDEGKGAQQL